MRNRILAGLASVLTAAAGLLVPATVPGLVQAANATTSDTVTATANGSPVGVNLKVLVLTGATAAGGAHAAGSNTGGAPNWSLTPLHSHALPVFEIYDQTGGTSGEYTAASNNTLNDNGKQHDAFADGRYTGTVTANTAITLGASAPTGTDKQVWASYEVPSSGSTTPAIDASTPAVVSTSTANTATTASFTPPTASVLVALIAGNNASAITISDANGLTWTRQASQFAGGGGAVVYTATVPGSVQPPSVTTSAASGVTSSGATLNGTVNPNGASTTYQFDYGTTTSYGTSVPSPAGSAGSGSAAVNESFGLTGLSASTTYHYRIEATNANGTVFGTDQTFTTSSASSSDTVTATANGSPVGVSERVLVLTGATEAGGANVGGSNTGGAPNFSLTPSQGASLPVFAIYDQTGGSSGEYTAESSNTFKDNSIQHDAFADGYYSGTVTGGTAVTLGSTTPTGTDKQVWAAYEVPSSGSGSPVIDGSTPAVVTSTSSNTVTTASFTPPAGSVLAVLATGNNATAITVSDANGLTWTKRAFQFAGGGGAVVYTATVGQASGGSGQHFMDFGASAQCTNGAGTSCTGNPNAYPLTDATCSSSIIPDSTERIPENATANATTGSSPYNFGPWTTSTGQMQTDIQGVRGNYTGTTDNILAWAACKWGWNEDWLRAEAVIESSWKQSEASDVANGCAHSFGILQVKDSPDTTCPIDHSGWGGMTDTQNSTAFDAEFIASYFRACYDGVITYLYPSGQTVASMANANGWSYVAWGCVGSWFSGDWYSSAAQGYITEVQNALASRSWTSLS